jgi:hypothetical protein
MNIPGFTAEASLYTMSTRYCSDSLHRVADNRVQPAMPFYGMNCSLNQNEAIGGIVDGLESIPVLGGLLGFIATVGGWIFCGGLPQAGLPPPFQPPKPPFP